MRCPWVLSVLFCIPLATPAPKEANVRNFEVSLDGRYLPPIAIDPTGGYQSCVDAAEAYCRRHSIALQPCASLRAILDPNRAKNLDKAGSNVWLFIGKVCIS